MKYRNSIFRHVFDCFSDKKQYNEGIRLQYILHRILDLSNHEQLTKDFIRTLPYGLDLFPDERKMEIEFFSYLDESKKNQFENGLLYKPNTVYYNLNEYNYNFEIEFQRQFFLSSSLSVKNNNQNNSFFYRQVISDYYNDESSLYLNGIDENNEKNIFSTHYQGNNDRNIYILLLCSMGFGKSTLCKHKQFGSLFLDCDEYAVRDGIFKNNKLFENAKSTNSWKEWNEFHSNFFFKKYKQDNRWRKQKPIFLSNNVDVLNNLVAHDNSKLIIIRVQHIFNYWESKRIRDIEAMALNNYKYVQEYNTDLYLDWNYEKDFFF